jgi:CHAT domain-containing protein/predicted negative regulator of RcsB-dependent stress response
MPRRKMFFTGTFLIVLLILTVLFPLSWSPHSVNDPTYLLDEAKRLSWLGNWDAAAPLFEHAESLFKIAGKRRDEIYARIGRLFARAETMSQPEVSHLLEKEIADPLVQVDKKLRLWGLMAKAAVDFNVDSAAAKQGWTEALQIANSLRENQWAARATGELGIIAFLEGNTTLAVNNIGKALRSAYWSGDIASLVDFISIAGIGFTEENRFDEALPLLKYAIKIAEGTEGAGFPWLAYQGLAAALIARGQWDEAQEVLHKALSRAQILNRHGQEAQVLVLLGDACIASRNVERAKQYFEEAGHLFTSIHWDRGLDEAMLKLSRIYRSKGQLEQAAEALRIGMKAKPGLDRYYQPRALTALAELRIAQKRFSEANTLFERAEGVTEATLINLHSGLESAAVVGSMSETYLAHFRLAVQQGSIADAFRIMERVRGRALANLLYSKNADQPESPTEAELNSKIATIQSQLMETDDAQKRFGLLGNLYRYERELAFADNQSTLDRHELPYRAASVTSIRHILRNDELMIEYVLAEPNSFCIVISNHGADIISLTAGSKQIQDLAHRYLADIESRKPGGQVSRDLYTILLGPVLGKFRQSRLIISPDGVLNFLPFESLQDTAGSFLIRSNTVSYVPSASVLWALRSVGAGAPAPRPLLAVGDVDYRSVRLRRTTQNHSLPGLILGGLAGLSGTQLEPLPESRDEVISIARTATHDASIMMGRDATETAFKAQPLSAFRVIHLAVHAVPDPQYPYRAGLVLGADSQDDGLLQVREIIRLRLNADLISLSACETGVGTSQGEAGMASLEQAFLMAGARAVVGSLWRVEDHSTSSLMKQFYKHLAQHEDKATALTHAKLDLLQRFGDLSPYYWAGFTLWGEGSATVSFEPN